MKKPSFTLLALCLGGALLMSCDGPVGPTPALTTSSSDSMPDVVVTPSEATLQPGESRQLEARLVAANGQTIPDQEFTWASSDAAVATVSSTGLVTAVAEGEATITATTHPFSGTAHVIVSSATHPDGIIAATVPLASRPFDPAVSSGGTYHVTRLDAAAVERGDLPDFAFTASIAAGSVPTDVVFHPSGSTSYVTNQFSQNIGVIDVASNTQVRTIPLQSDAFEVAASPDGGTVYAADNANHVYAIDAATQTIRTTLTVSSICNGLAFNPRGDRVYASLLFSGEVVEIDAHADTVIRRMLIGGSVLQGIVVSTDGSELYVADEGSGVLRVVDIASGTQVAEVPLAGGAFGVALSPDNAQVYVSIPFGGVVRVVDRATRSVVKSIATSGTPRGIAFSVEGETAVIANESGWVDFIR